MNPIKHLHLALIAMGAILLAPSVRGEARIVTTAVEAVNWTGGVTYTYDGSGNISAIGEDTFVYDHVGRLVHAEVNDVPRDYAYDAFGNRIACEEEGSRCDGGRATDPETNRIVGLRYDGRGNIEAYAGHDYSYDAVGMLVRDRFGVAAREFIYTADDERLATYAVGSTWRWTVREVSGKVLREFASADGARGIGTDGWAWTRDNIFRDGLLLASRQKVNEAITTYYYHLDHLGSPRRVTDQSDLTVGVHDYFAFGPEAGGGTDEPSATTLKYTGHERDRWLGEYADTLDYMHARFYSPTMGRFMSVDPALSVSRALPNPQTWNRYTYVRNNPLRLVDPKGLLDYEAFLLGRSITVHISDALTQRQQAALKRKIDNSLKVLNDKAEAGKLTREDFQVLSNIQEVRVVQARVVNGQETRSSVDERTGVFTMTDRYVAASSTKWTASVIGHDGFHVEQFKQGGFWLSRGLEAEPPAMEYQLGLGRRIGLDAASLRYLRDLIGDPARLEQYRQQPAAADNED